MTSHVHEVRAAAAPTSLVGRLGILLPPMCDLDCPGRLGGFLGSSSSFRRSSSSGGGSGGSSCQLLWGLLRLVCWLGPGLRQARCGEGGPRCSDEPAFHISHWANTAMTCMALDLAGALASAAPFLFSNCRTCVAVWMLVPGGSGVGHGHDTWISPGLLDLRPCPRREDANNRSYYFIIISCILQYTLLPKALD